MLYFFIFAVVVAVFCLIIYVVSPAEPINNKRYVPRPAFNTKQGYFEYIAKKYKKYHELLKKDLNFGISDYAKRMELMKDLVSMIQFDMTTFLIMNGVDDSELLFTVVSISEEYYKLDRKIGLMGMILKLVSETERTFDHLLYDYNNHTKNYSFYYNKDSCFLADNTISVKKFNFIFNRLLDNYYSFCNRGTNSGRIHIYLTIIQKLYFYYLSLLDVDVKQATKQAIELVKISFALDDYLKKDPSEAFDEFSEIRKELKLKLKNGILGKKTNTLLEL